MATGTRTDSNAAGKDDAREAAELESIVRERLGRSPTRVERIPAGLGTRRFYRLSFEDGSPETLIARVEASEADAPAAGVDAPPAWLPEPALEPLRSFLEDAGLPVPTSALHLPDRGLDLLEDVGDHTLLDVARDAERAAEIPARYAEACQLIAKLQTLVASAEEVPAFGRVYDRALVETKAWKWLSWTLPLLLEREATASERADVTALFSHIADLAESAPRRLSHRDFKAENLHLVSGTTRGESERLVMIDVQGAFLAPPEYDLVCLLYDLQVELPEDQVRRHFEQTLVALPDALDPDRAWERFDALAIARLCKDVSHVVHATRVRADGRRFHEVRRGFELLLRAARRREGTFPGIRGLISVTEALTAAAGSADSGARG